MVYQEIAISLSSSIVFTFKTITTVFPSVSGKPEDVFVLAGCSGSSQLICCSGLIRSLLLLRQT